MREKRFIELVNLYLDREIDSNEKAELESALSASSRRRAVFLSYSRLQNVAEKACSKKCPQLQLSVDLHKYAELARNADQRIFRGFFVSAAAVVLFALTVGLALQYLVTPSAFSVDLPVQDRRAETFSGQPQLAEPNLVDLALDVRLRPLSGLTGMNFFPLPVQAAPARDSWDLGGLGYDLDLIMQGVFTEGNRAIVFHPSPLPDQNQWVQPEQPLPFESASLRFKR